MSKGSICEINVIWKPPPTNVLKINIDASFIDANTSISFVAKDYQDLLVKSKAYSVGMVPIDIDEIWALREALSWALATIHLHIILELDSLFATCTILGNTKFGWWHKGCILGCIKIMDSLVFSNP